MNQRERIDHMVNLVWHLTPAELTRLMLRPVCSDARIAMSMRVEEATVEEYDNFDVPHYRGNVFYEWLRRNPVYGPEPEPMDMSDCPF